MSYRDFRCREITKRGFGTSPLAAKLNLSVNMIETHQMDIEEKLGLRSAAELSEKPAHWMVEATRRNFSRRCARASVRLPFLG
jgi:DNA-binding NarL/FixJ family response regulator